MAQPRVGAVAKLDRIFPLVIADLVCEMMGDRILLFESNSNRVACIDLVRWRLSWHTHDDKRNEAPESVSWLHVGQPCRESLLLQQTHGPHQRSMIPRFFTQLPQVFSLVAVNSQDAPFCGLQFCWDNRDFRVQVFSNDQVYIHEPPMLYSHFAFAANGFRFSGGTLVVTSNREMRLFDMETKLWQDIHGCCPFELDFVCGQWCISEERIVITSGLQTATFDLRTKSWRVARERCGLEHIANLMTRGDRIFGRIESGLVELVNDAWKFRSHLSFAWGLGFEIACAK